MWGVRYGRTHEGVRAEPPVDPCFPTRLLENHPLNVI